MAEAATQAAKPAPGAAGRAGGARQAAAHTLDSRRMFSEPGKPTERQADARSMRAMHHSADTAKPWLTPLLVSKAQASPGQPLTQAIRAEMECRFDHDFGDVRIHSDAAAGRAATSLGAAAFTAGTDIAFAAGRYAPQTPEGRQLLAHELAHVVQQRTTGQVVQLAVEGAPEATVLTLNWDVHFKLSRPNPNELFAAPEEVLTPEGLFEYRALLLALTTDPLQQAQIEGSASSEGDHAENVRLSARRARWIANEIGPLRVHTAPGHRADCPQSAEGEYACGASHAHSFADPADRRATVRLFRPATSFPSTVPLPFHPAPSQAPSGTQTKEPEGARQQEPPQGGTAGTTQVGLQGGVGIARHFYITPAGPNDPLTEWVTQVVVTATRQLHEKDRSGFELQGAIQVQYSLTSGQWSVGAGPQLSYVVPFASNKFQWSSFVQLVAGGNVSAGSGLLQPVLGTQLAWQPTDWFNLSAQIGAGGTAQFPGPGSVDLSGLFIITVQH
jgi:outer membrane protein OmpA-like peptidoglycan-associated protein